MCRTPIKECFKSVSYYALALDESTDIKETAQLCVFIQRVKSNFDLHEKFLQMVPMKGTTTGADTSILAYVLGFVQEF
jgi:hypothetical protein